MATNAKLKRYNGSAWEQYYPQTTTDQVVGLATEISDIYTDIGTRLPLTGGTVTGSTRFSNGTNYFGGTTSNTAEIWMQTGIAGSPQIVFTDNQGDMSWAIGGDDDDNNFKIHGSASGTIPTINALATPLFEITTTGDALVNGNTVWHEGNLDPSSLGGGGYADGVVETRASVDTDFWVGTQSQYDSITPDSTTLYFIKP